MTYEELLTELARRQALIVHCSRLGHGGEENPKLFPDDMQHAWRVAAQDAGDLACSVIWPQHQNTFGNVGIVLKPRCIASIQSVHSRDAGSSLDASGRRQGFGSVVSVESVAETFGQVEEHNEWFVRDADVLGSFIKFENGQILVDKLFSYPDPLLLGQMAVDSLVTRIDIEEVIAEIPGKPVYSLGSSSIVRFNSGQWDPIDSRELYGI